MERLIEAVVDMQDELLGKAATLAQNKETDEEENTDNEDSIKEYLGNSPADEEYFYLIKDTTGFIITDANDEEVYNEKQANIESGDAKAFILAALKELEIANVSYDIIMKYIIPEEEAKTEQDENPQEPKEQTEEMGKDTPEKTTAVPDAATI